MRQRLDMKSAYSALLKILIQRDLPNNKIDEFRSRFARHDVKVIHPADPIENHLAPADIILSNPDPKSVLEIATNLKWIQLLSSGIDGYLNFKDAPFKVTTAHGIHASPIAEHVLMSMLQFERKQRFFECRQKECVWDRQARLPGLLKNRALGFVGYGSIAAELVKLVKPFNLEIQAVTRRPESKSPPPAVRLLGMEFLDTLLNTSDHIVITLPSTEETRHIISSERLGLMKKGAYLHNVARGNLIDEKALIDALRADHLGGAALDVFEREPLQSGSPFWRLDSCFVTPHIAGHHRNLDIEIFELFTRNLERFEGGQSLVNEADFSRGY